MGEAVAKIACDACNSSDALQVFKQADGKLDGYCFSCNTRYPTIEPSKISGVPTTSVPTNKPTPTSMGVEDVLKLTSAPLEDRGIRQEVLDAFGVKVSYGSDGNIDKHFYPIHSKQGELVAYKQRLCSTKDFTKIGKEKSKALFGQGSCPSNRKLFVTEGEVDAMAMYQILLDGMPRKSRERGYLPSVVGVTVGAQGGANQLMENADFLAKFSEIIIVFDSDEPGQQGAEKIAQTLEHRVLLAKLPEKDVGMMLEKGKGDEAYKACMFESKPYEPDGIINAGDAWDRYKDRKSAECHPYPEAFAELNEKTYGYRFGSVVTVTSGSGMGKTQFIREVMYDVLNTTEEKIAYIALEEDVGDTIEGLMALHLNKRISLPDVKVSEQEEKDAFNELFGTGRVELYDHFGGMDDSDLFSRIKYFNTYLGCRVFALDHLSIVISETADEGDERRRIDAVMTKLAKIAKSLDIVIFLVVHLRKAQQGKSFEEGHVPTSDDLRGSGSIKQLSWDVIALSRNQQEPDPMKRNTTGLHVLKCRFSGRTGSAGYARYDELTGRMMYSDDPTTSDEFQEVM